MNKLRTFIAIELSDEIKQTIKDIEDSLKVLGCDIKWVRPEIAHLTLKFLGDVDLDTIETIGRALTESVHGLPPIQTQLTQLGIFPDIRRPRILWIGLDDKEGRIKQLAESVETALGNIRFKKEEREFKPHITIGRLRSSKNVIQLAEAVKGFSGPAGRRQSIDHITLFKSTLTPAGPMYEVLKKFSGSL